MDPATIAMMIQAAIAVGNMASGLFGKDEISTELKKAYDLLAQRAEKGLPTSVEASMRRTGQSQIATQASGEQSRGAAALASRGMSNSSAADSMLASISQGVLGANASLESDIMMQDEQVRERAQMALAGVAGNIGEIKQARATARGESIGSGLGMLANLFSEDEDPLQQILSAMSLGQRLPVDEAQTPIGIYGKGGYDFMNPNQIDALQMLQMFKMLQSGNIEDSMLYLNR